MSAIPPRRVVQRTRSALVAARIAGQRQRGFSLIESLIGFLILALGILGVTEMQSLVVGASSDSHQRNAAVHMAQDQIERFRAWRPGVSGADFDAIADGNDTPPSLVSDPLGAQFSRQWAVVENTGSGQPRYKTVTVTVTWEGKEGNNPDVSTRQVTLQTKISAVPLAVVPVPPPPPPAS